MFPESGLWPSTRPRNRLSPVPMTRVCLLTTSPIRFLSKSSSLSEFRVLNIRQMKQQAPVRRKIRKMPVQPPRANQMPVDQDWGNVWPGPRTFHPATVPLPVRQGFTEKGAAPPGKFANAELMKIPNFLHLTPPVVKRQCEALKKFCTEWPKGLETEEQWSQRDNFPVTVITSDYCHGLPTIRNPLARIVSLKVKLSDLTLDKHSRDKFLRLVGERYDEETDTLTIVTDRCPTRQQNQEYAEYLLAALYHESWTRESWEDAKTEADMETYFWERNKSKQSAEAIWNWQSKDVQAVPETFPVAVETLINDGENEYNLGKYKEEALKLLKLPKYS